jgi:predicted GTPase
VQWLTVLLPLQPPKYVVYSSSTVPSASHIPPCVPFFCYALPFLQSLAEAHVVVLVLDGNQALTKQDLSLAQKAVDEGRAILVVLNKMDAVENRKLVEDGVTDRLQSAIWQAFGVECVAISALTGQGLENIMPAVYVFLSASLQR